MSKFSKIKERLASLLIEVEFATVKTDKAVFEYDGEELVEGTKVYVIDEETNERVAAADGEYTTEDNKVITVANGEVVSIVEKEEEPVEEPTEEPKDGEEPIEAEEEPKDGEEPVEEPKDEVAELKTKVEELTAIVNELIGLVEDMKKETEEKFSKISLAKPASEEFEQTTIKKTGDARVDKLLNAWGKK